MKRIASLVSSLALAAQPVTAQNLWVVDDDPGAGVDFGDIQSAVNVASSKDGVLVRDGSYDRFTITAKSLSVFADDGASVEIQDAGNLDSGHAVPGQLALGSVK